MTPSRPAEPARRPSRGWPARGWPARGWAPRGWPARRWLADGGLALTLTVIGLVGTRQAALHQSPAGPVGPFGYGLVAVAALSLLPRRQWPVLTLATVTLATTAYLVQGYPYGPILLSLLVAVYTVARHRPARTAAIAGAVAAVLLAGHVFIGRGVGPGLVGIVPASAWVVVPLAIGMTLRLHTESVARNQAELARQHVDSERLRVAREVHDIVGHGLSSIAMQADIALHLLARQPEHAVVALTAISRTSREALDELRITLAGVRQPGDDARAPLPGLARLDALVARMSDSGVAVTVQSAGPPEPGADAAAAGPGPRPVPGPVDLTAYRVIQESLTNVLRHAGPTVGVVVRMEHRDGELIVEVQDNGRGGPAAPAGQGITGMRHRVEALGGALEAGPGEAGGFRVWARLPTS